MFNDMEDVEEWLAPLDYAAFWNAAEGLELELEPKESCDAQIARGSIDEATVLHVLKGLARLELVERFRLRARGRTWRSLH